MTPNNTLMIVDDEREILKTIHRQFRKKYRVITAINASSALDIMSQDNVQVIISDQRMPEMKGTELFSHIQKKYPDVIQILLTGYSDIQAVIDAINKGNVYQYLTKPWNIETLENVVDKAFERFWLVNNNRQLMNELKETNKKLEKEIQERKAVEQELKKNQNLLEFQIEVRTAQLQQMNQLLLEAKDMAERAERANQNKNEFLVNKTQDMRNTSNMLYKYSQKLKH